MWAEVGGAYCSHGDVGSVLEESVEVLPIPIDMVRPPPPFIF